MKYPYFFTKNVSVISFQEEQNKNYNQIKSKAQLHTLVAFSREPFFPVRLNIKLELVKPRLCLNVSFKINSFSNYFLDVRTKSYANRGFTFQKHYRSEKSVNTSLKMLAKIKIHRNFIILKLLGN